MKFTGRWVLTACTALASLPGCGPAPQSQPSTAAPAKGALSPQALLTLDALKPPVAKPQNRPYDQPLPDAAAQAMEEARRLRRKNDIAGAIEQLQRAKSFAPGNPKILQLLGMAYVSLPDYPQAVENLRAAAEYAGDDFRLQLLLAQLSRGLKQPDEAIRRFRLALLCDNAKPSDPQTAFALLALAHLLEEEGYWTACLECFERMENWVRRYGRQYESDPLLQDFVLRPEKLLAARGRLLMQLHRPQEAVDFLRRAYRRDHSDALTTQWLFNALLAGQNLTEAEVLLTELAGQNLQSALVPSLAEDLCSAARDKTLPMRIWQTFRAQNEASVPLAIALAQSARTLGAPQDAITILNSVLSDQPDEVQAVKLLVETSLQTQDRTKVLRLLADRIHQDSRSAEGVRAGVKAVADSKPPASLAETFSRLAYQDASDRKYALHYVAGLLEIEQGRTLKAADHFQRAIRLKKDFYPAYDALLELHLHAGDQQGLQTLLEMCKETAKEGYYYNYLLGRARLSEGNLDSAIDALRAAHEANPSHLPTLLALAEAYRLQSHLRGVAEERNQLADRAEEALQKAIRLGPENIQTYRKLFDLYVLQQQYDKALDLTRNLAKTLPSSPEAGALLVQAYLLARQPDQANRLLARLLQRFPDNADVRLLTVRELVGRFPGVLPQPIYRKALDQVEDLRKKHPDDVHVLRMLGRLLSQAVAEQYPQAAEVWRQLYEKTHKDPEVGETLVLVCLRAGQYAQAEALAKELLQRAPQSATFRLMLVDAMVQAGRPDEAARQILTWREEQPNNPAWLLLLLDLYQAKGRFDDALKLLEELQNAAEPILPAPALRARKTTLLCRAGRYDQAVKFLAHETDPGVFGSLTQELIRAGQFDLLVKTLQEAHQRIEKPEYRDAIQSDLLYAFMRAGRIDQAMAYIDREIAEQQAAASRPADAHLRATTLRETAVRTLLGADRLKDAAQRLKDYLAEDPNNAELHNLYSSLLTEQGKIPESVLELERAFSLKPKDASYQNNLAYILAETGQQLKRAEELSKMCLQTEGPRSTSADTLGWVYYKQGRLSEAAEVFLTILQGQDEPGKGGVGRDEENDLHPVIWDHAGDVFYRLGWFDRAVRYWKQALDAAKKETLVTREIRMIRDNTPGKIQAVRDKALPRVAPLGKTMEEALKEASRKQP